MWVGEGQTEKAGERWAREGQTEGTGPVQEISHLRARALLLFLVTMAEGNILGHRRHPLSHRHAHLGRRLTDRRRLLHHRPRCLDDRRWAAARGGALALLTNALLAVIFLHLETFRHVALDRETRVRQGHPRPWKVMEGHGRSWTVMVDGHGRP